MVSDGEECVVVIVAVNEASETRCSFREGELEFISVSVPFSYMVIIFYFWLQSLVSMAQVLKGPGKSNLILLATTVKVCHEFSKVVTRVLPQNFVWVFFPHTPFYPQAVRCFATYSSFKGAITGLVLIFSNHIYCICGEYCLQ